MKKHSQRSQWRYLSNKSNCLNFNCRTVANEKSLKRKCQTDSYQHLHQLNWSNKILKNLSEYLSRKTLKTQLLKIIQRWRVYSKSNNKSSKKSFNSRKNNTLKKYTIWRRNYSKSSSRKSHLKKNTKPRRTCFSNS